ncbi:helix-turn-helix domain-containing protein [Nocardia otitidiscaviarum]|uniref:helix-turn-helix domain-containing protein n=1 Tax=Nocardia otitidiscaviarum TaxID=1823 RepID=UPI002456CF61|nr:helix-turn-helix transcriptional regulator [Nocardia otitidiscaviarum]
MKSHTLPARMLGMTLESIRERIRPVMSREAAAKALGVSQQTLWRVEKAQWDKPPKKTMILALCRLYKVGDAEERTVLDLLEGANESGWWQKFGDAMAPGFSQFVARESTARRMFSYQDPLLPGLLQTPAYRRALAFAIDPSTDDETVAESVALAIRRQRRLAGASDERLEVNLVLAEGVLRQRIGGRHVMYEQLTRLVEVSELDTVSLRVVPEGTPHVGLVTGPFVLLESPRSAVEWVPDEPPTVYLQHFTGSLYLGRHEEVQRYYRAFEAIEEAALSLAESRDLIACIAKETQP